ncbi:mannosyl-oligosaccharide alpha-1,2-mannosidase IA-like [Bradysia coprophila]|uniref:mannosyl-oligosaccharide alpha-1,2-mannosidase IA-like n=1 Tax=Bradysia coprophila TaxID=38358 RepID=UPI00187DC570|nr:mannosyl-oligosaccharide alpha-1,2-mannosidase IA-like [Bradysia coprophila]
MWRELLQPYKMRSPVTVFLKPFRSVEQLSLLFLMTTHICLANVIRSNDQTPQERRNKIREMTLHAWRNYETYAWGKNELRPVSRLPNRGSVFGNSEIGATIVDSLDTLYIMGLNEEYQKGRDWIEKNFSFGNVNGDLSVFETNIRFVGGLLSMYAFTGDELFKTKAQEVADKLLPAFETDSGIPRSLVNIQTGYSKNYNWASGSILSELGSLHLEFTYLSDITGNPIYRDRVENVRQVLNEATKLNGLYPNFIDPISGRWGQHHISLGALGDSFYEYLLKAWIQSNKTDTTARQMYDSAMTAIIENHLIQISAGGLIYASDMKYGRLDHKMGHLACFAGGMFALGASTQNDENSENHMKIGEGITNTCHESYVRTATHLGPEAFSFERSWEAKSSVGQDQYYILRPEVFESYFILWRLTHDQKYRDWGWDAVEALERYCRTSGGYSGIRNVYSPFPVKDDVQQSFFLAESLKYLYLLYSDDSLLSLDEWVFNT